MNAPLFLELERAGVHLSVSPSGELKAKGKPDDVKRLLPVIRENKDALIAELSEARREAFEERAAIMEYEGGLSSWEAERLAREEQDGRKGDAGSSCWWRVRFPDGGAVEVFSPSGNTRAGILRSYPAAASAEPFTPDATRPDAPMTEGEEAAIRAWLASIGEQAREVVDEALAVCQRDAGARGYVIGRVNLS